MIRLTTLGSLDLRTAGGAEVRAVLQQPKRLALLTWLALSANGRFARRDTLLALFWPELDQEHARAALRRALYFLRQALGEQVIVGRGDDEVGLAAGALWCDALEFDSALARGDGRAALALYHGDLLAGFFVAGAGEAERWLDAERDRRRAAAVKAAWALAESPATPKDQALEWARRALELDPNDESAPQRQRRLITRLGETPSAPSTARAARVAVLPFTVHGGPAFAYLQEGMVDLLTAGLDGVAGFGVVDARAVLHSMSSGSGTTAERLALTHVVKGALVESGGQLRLSATLERISGRVEARAEAQGASEAALFDLVDALTRQLLAERQGGPGTRIARLAGRTTESLTALKADLSGEHEFRMGRFREAAEAFERAVSLDVSFAFAWYRLASARAALALHALAREASAQAMRHRQRLSPRDRLLVEAQDAWLAGVSVEAERRYAALLAEYPDDLEATYLLGDVYFHSNPYRGRSIREAREPFERTLAIEPAHNGALAKLARLDALEGRLDDLGARVDLFLRSSPDADQALALRTLRAFRVGGAVEKGQVVLEAATARALSVAIAFGDAVMYGDAIEAADTLGQAVLAVVRSAELRALARTMLAHIALARGRADAALAGLAAARTDDRAWTLGVEGLLAGAPWLDLPDAVAAEVRAALTALDTAAAPVNVVAPLDLHNGLHPQIRGYGLGLLAARAGDLPALVDAAEQLAELPIPAGAEALAERMGRTLGALVRRANGDAAGALAVLEAARTDVWYQHAVASPVFADCYSRLLRAELLIKAGRGAEAKGWLLAIGERSPWELPFVAPARRLATALA